MKIEVVNYSKKLKGNIVLDNVSMTMESGNVYGLKGTNGSGKTMLMRAIAGLILPGSGMVIIDGKQVGTDIDFPQDMGLLIEYPAFVGNYTGYENLKMITDIRKKAGRDEIRHSLEMVGLDPDDKRTFRKYSLGMKQKLGIACAIVENPQLLILDEPFNALDEKGCQVVRDVINDFKRRGALVILACHDKTELEAVSDKIYEIYEGKLWGDEGVEKK